MSAQHAHHALYLLVFIVFSPYLRDDESLVAPLTNSFVKSKYHYNANAQADLNAFSNYIRKNVSGQQQLSGVYLNVSGDYLSGGGDLEGYGIRRDGLSGGNIGRGQPWQ